MENLNVIHDALEDLALSVGAYLDEEMLEDLTNMVYEHLVRLAV